METKKKRNPKKKSLVVVAVIAIIALLLTGTFAWSAIANYINEFENDVIEDSELIDDFDPDTGNKDVAVINTGEKDLYVRIKLNEYMEVYNQLTERYESLKNSEYSVGRDSEGDRFPAPDGQPDSSQWTLHSPDAAGTNCADCGEVFHDYWNWEMGGERTEPLYDSKGNSYTAPVSSVMTYAQWGATGRPHDTWVLCDDGYFYWSTALKPGEATGLLLNQVDKLFDEDEIAKYYYAIDVIMEVVSDNDLNCWLDGNIGDPNKQGHEFEQASPDAQDLLKGAAGWIKITDDMKVEDPDIEDFDYDGDGWLNKDEQEDYQNHLKGDDNLIEGEDGRFYYPLGIPKNVFEVVNSDGTSKQPAEYVYDKNGNPGSSTTVPAIKGNDGYYVEDPQGSNIYKKVNNDGTLLQSPAVWGGQDGKFGGGDDQTVYKYGNDYYISLGQNVFQKVIGTTVGSLVGGGPDENPSTEPVTPIINVHGKYYIGPMTDSDGVQYYYGDKTTGGNGKVMSSYGSKHATDDIFYLVGEYMTTEKPSQPMPDVGDTFNMGIDKDGNVLEWQVLDVDVQNGKILVITTTVAAECLFHDTTPYPGWRNSNIRRYLRDEFINNFTSAEQEKILVTDVSTKSAYNSTIMDVTQDKLFLLSSAEITQYWSANANRKPKTTIMGVLSPSSQNKTSWGYNRYWLRDPITNTSYAAFIDNHGNICGTSVTYGKYASASDRNQGGVRPAMWISVN